jgi:hypothetical protein
LPVLVVAAFFMALLPLHGPRLLLSVSCLFASVQSSWSMAGPTSIGQS